MGFMVFGEDDCARIAQFLLNQFFHPDAFTNPEWNRHQEGSQPSRSISQIAVKNTIKFQKRFFVKRDEIQLAGLYAASAQTVLHRVRRKSSVVLLAGEAFLLGGSNDFAVAHETRSAVVIK